MAEDEVVLKITKKELVPDETWIRQTEDGIVYFEKLSPPERLYVKSREGIYSGKEIDAKVPIRKNDDTEYTLVHGNAFYFTSNEKVYKAVLSLSEGITISSQRDIIEGEKFHSWGVCSRTINGKIYVYRMCDDPNKDGFQIDMREEVLKELEVLSVHRGTVIMYDQKYKNSPPSVRKLGENAIIIEGKAYIYCADASPFIYMAHDYDFMRIHILDTRSMMFLPPVRIEGVERIDDIIGVHNREITVEGVIDNEDYLVTAQLPLKFLAGYSAITQANVDKDKLIQELLDDAEKLREEIKKMKLAETKSTQREGPCCAVCLDKVPNIIFYDCKHVAACEDCFNTASRDPSAAFKNCPTCRNSITKTENVFL